MAERSLVQRLGIKPGFRVFCLNAPFPMDELLGPLPAGASIVTSAGGDADAVLAFARTAADVATHAPAALAAARPGGLLWWVYPKGAAKVPTDINRDRGWAPLFDAGYDPVSQIAIDATWSALRFKHDPALRALRAARGARVGGR